MQKTAILYRSPHHGNTKKLLDAIVKAHPEVDLIPAGEEGASLSSYGMIGFASGMYMGKLHRMVRKSLSAMNGEGRKAFVIYTCGDNEGEKYGDRILEVLRKKGFETCGFYWCLGHDSFGPLKLIGGVHKGRPNAEDIRGAVRFFDQLAEGAEA